jgi:hypothetical protein
MSHSWHQYVFRSGSAAVIAVVMVVELVGIELNGLCLCVFVRRR